MTASSGIGQPGTEATIALRKYLALARARACTPLASDRS
jgi:hypothetical protein